MKKISANQFESIHFGLEIPDTDGDCEQVSFTVDDFSFDTAACFNDSTGDFSVFMSVTNRESGESFGTGACSGSMNNDGDVTLTCTTK